MNVKCKSIDCWNVFEGSRFSSCPECGSGDVEIILPIYVNVYITNLVRGGSEEGGWYYTCGEPIESISAGSEEEANELMVKYKEKYSNVGRRPLTSVLSSGEYFVTMEGHFAEEFPKQRPFYE